MVEVAQGGCSRVFPKRLERRGAERPTLFIQALQRVTQLARNDENRGVPLAMESPMITGVDPIQGLGDFHFPFETRDPYRPRTAPGRISAGECSEVE
eukprot:3026203-Heterocapsa_arctica.AAC.1